MNVTFRDENHFHDESHFLSGWQKREKIFSWDNKKEKVTERDRRVDR